MNKLILTILLLGIHHVSNAGILGFGLSESEAKESASINVSLQCLNGSFGFEVASSIELGEAYEGNSCEIDSANECREGFLVKVLSFECTDR